MLKIHTHDLVKEYSSDLVLHIQIGGLTQDKTLGPYESSFKNTGFYNPHNATEQCLINSVSSLGPFQTCAKTNVNSDGSRK